MAVADDVMKRDLTPDDPRPDGRPFYIHANCPTCGTALVLLDPLEDPNIAPEDIWHDEWACPTCRDCVWMDWPQVQYDALNAVVEDVQRRFASDSNDKPS